MALAYLFAEFGSILSRGGPSWAGWKNGRLWSVLCWGLFMCVCLCPVSWG